MRRVAIAATFGLIVFALLGAAARGSGPRPLGPLPRLASQPDPKQVALGRQLFFDGRLAGDGSTSCASCHVPEMGWTDGLPMSKGYPGALYFRNTPTVLNVAWGEYLYWDGRLPAADLPTLVRDHISEAHFMQADGRLIIERLRQMPGYEEGFIDAFGGEPSYGKILNALAAYVRTLSSRDVPFDRYLRGHSTALNPSARRGLALFRGKAGCIECHNGPMLSDRGFHSVGLASTQDIFATPERHITFRRFFKTLGVGQYATLRQDVGRFGVTKNPADTGLFRTPTLREVSRTAPYMHDGSLATLTDVVAFYDQGGGSGESKDPRLSPLGLSTSQQNDLVSFLESLAGDAVTEEPVELPRWAVRQLGEN